MIYKRVAARLRAQDWVAITIELGIVVLGVFIGTWVANWNQEQGAKRETQRMLVQLKPNLTSLTDYYDGARAYFGTTRRYAATALGGWRGDREVSDVEFVIAAYQASQITGISTNGSTWATVLGADQLRRVNDLAIRNDLSLLMSADYTQLDLTAVDTPYRQNVRRLIPVEIQEAIRKRCGDLIPSDRPSRVVLPPTCDLKIAADQAAATATILRAHPALMQDLQWHLAAEAALLENMISFETTTRDLQKRIGALNG